MTGTDLYDAWWDATRERRLVIQCCTGCEALQHPPRSVCLSCLGGDLHWRAMSGAGTVDSWTTVHRSPGPGFDPGYVVARVRLAEGPLLLSNLIGPDGYRCGEAVRISWQPLPDGRHLPLFVKDVTEPAESIEPTGA